jgi:hypothetical protein
MYIGMARQERNPKSPKFITRKRLWKLKKSLSHAD